MHNIVWFGKLNAFMFLLFKTDFIELENLLIPDILNRSRDTHPSITRAITLQRFVKSLRLSFSFQSSGWFKRWAPEEMWMLTQARKGIFDGLKLYLQK